MVYRVQVYLANEAIKIFTRRGHDWTHRFKKVAHDAWHIKAGFRERMRQFVGISVLAGMFQRCHQRTARITRSSFADCRFR
jgi:hypothetical protein